MTLRGRGARGEPDRASYPQIQYQGEKPTDSAKYRKARQDRFKEGHLLRWRLSQEINTLTTKQPGLDIQGLVEAIVESEGHTETSQNKGENWFP